MVLTVVAALLVGQPPFPTPADDGIRVTHDYVADLAALAPTVPVEQRAWLRYVRPYGAIRCAPAEIFDMPSPGTPGWPVAEAYCREHRERISEIREAATLPVLGFPLSTQTQPEINQLPACVGSHDVDADPPVEVPPRVFDVKYPYIGFLRACTRFLRLDAMVAVIDKDGTLVANDIRALIRIAHHSGEHANSIGEYLSFAVLRVATSTLRHALETDAGLLRTEDLQAISEDLRGFPSDGRIRPRLDFERALLLDVLQRSYSDDGAGDGRLTLNGVREIDLLAGGGTEPSGKSLEQLLNSNVIYAGYFWANVATRMQSVEEFDRRTDLGELGRPLWEWSRWPSDEPDLDEAALRDYRGKYPLTRIVIPDLRKFVVASESMLQTRDAARLSIALELFRRESGHWPTRVDELVPKFLESVPLDRFTGQPLCYSMTDGKPVVYSRGQDLDDDGGRMGDKADVLADWRPPLAPKNDADPPPDGDWVLFGSGLVPPR